MYGIAMRANTEDRVKSREEEDIEKYMYLYDFGFSVVSQTPLPTSYDRGICLF